MRIAHNATRHQFEAVDDSGGIMGEISYAPRDNGVLIANHTGVRPEFRGQGVAQELLDALAAHARENNLKILPVCSYVVAAFKRNPERYRDVMLKPNPDPDAFL